MFCIIISHKENFANATELILSLCSANKMDARISYLNEFDSTLSTYDDIIFYLTNDDLAGEHCQIHLARGAKVINKEFLLGNKTKLYLQQKARRAGVSVPNSITLESFKNLSEITKKIDFPFYIKSMRHVHDIFRIKNKNELLKIEGSLDKSLNFYIEEAVDGCGRNLEKYYWINDKTFSRNGNAYRADIVLALEKIADALNFEIFSADFMVGNNDYFCIDINPAPAFFGSSDAREAFVDFVLDNVKNQRSAERRPTIIFSNSGKILR